MSDRAKLLAEQFRAMTPEEQDEFLDELWQFGAEDGPPNPYSDEESWRAELDRRLASVADGTAVLYDAADVFREARARLPKEGPRHRDLRQQRGPNSTAPVTMTPGEAGGPSARSSSRPSKRPSLAL